jgi:gamma-glutamylcyclotransferase (GGCT)/AIG2-like uncharacterized protein YtfP
MSLIATPTAIFVYGTLQPGYSPYATYCQPHPHQTQSAIVYGQLYHLPLGYPALVVGGDRPVHGYCLRFADPNILTILDDYEQHDSIALRATYPQLDADRAMADLAYDRQLITSFTPDGQPLGSIWVYTMTIAQITQLQGQFLPQGQWPPLSCLNL